MVTYKMEHARSQIATYLTFDQKKNHPQKKGRLRELHQCDLKAQESSKAQVEHSTKLQRSGLS